MVVSQLKTTSQNVCRNGLCMSSLTLAVTYECITPHFMVLLGSDNFPCVQGWFKGFDHFMVVVVFHWL